MNPINPLTVGSAIIIAIIITLLGCPLPAVFFITMIATVIVMMLGAMFLDRRLTLWELEHVLYRIREIVVEDDVGNVGKSYKLERAYRFPIGWGYWHVYNNRAYDSQEVAIGVMKETIESDQKELMELRARFNKGKSRIVTNNVGPTQGSDAVAVKNGVVKGRPTVRVGGVINAGGSGGRSVRGKSRKKKSESKASKDDLKSVNSLRAELEGE